MQNFTILEKVGSGSYSTVYRARDNRNQHIVALKIMKFPYTKGKRLQDMELTALKKFKSNPCVISLLQCFMQNDIMYMIFELGGVTLIDYYRRHPGKFTEQQVKLISYQIALALHDMHRSSYMHRDLKPENIMIDPETKLVKLVDFGLCKKWEIEINTNYVTTRWYRSPQLILNLPYGLNIDVFALGCVMLELYLGYEAFPGKDAIDQLNKVFSVIGTPTKEEWPQGMHHLQEKRIVFPMYQKTDLRSHISTISQQGIDLIEKMILCNPKERISAKQIIEHPYFKNIDINLLPQPVQRYTRQIRPPVIQYPLKLSVPALNDKLKSGSTDTSTSRKLINHKRKLELVSASIVQKRLNYASQNEIAEDYQIKINGETELQKQHEIQKLQNKTFTYLHPFRHSSNSDMHLSSQSTRAKKKLNLTILDRFNTIQSVRNNTTVNNNFDGMSYGENQRKRQLSTNREPIIQSENNKKSLQKILSYDTGRVSDHSLSIGK